MDYGSLDYRLTGDGFADLVLRINDAVLDLHQLGDSPDPMEEMMTAALALARGDGPPQIFFDPEDGGLYEWRIRLRHKRVHLTVNYVDASTGKGRTPPRGGPTRVFETQCSVLEFCSVVAAGAAQVFERHSPEELEALWLAPFPIELLQGLQTTVDQLRP